MVFIKAYRSLNGFDTRLKFSSWLYRIAHNLGVDFLRKNARRNHTSLDAEDENNQALLEVLASDENIALNFSSEEQKKAVRNIIQSLPEKYKTVLVLSYLEDKSYDEISDILQMPINTV
jgi:RNA polymerase sigma-70 factor (ECF subfamily)